MKFLSVLKWKFPTVFGHNLKFPQSTPCFKVSAEIPFRSDSRFATVPTAPSLGSFFVRNPVGTMMRPGGLFIVSCSVSVQVAWQRFACSHLCLMNRLNAATFGPSAAFLRFLHVDEYRVRAEGWHHLLWPCTSGMNPHLLVEQFWLIVGSGSATPSNISSTSEIKANPACRDLSRQP